MDVFKDLLINLEDGSREKLDLWLFNASYPQLYQALDFITSLNNSPELNPRDLKVYKSYIQVLMKGRFLELPRSPSPTINNSAQSSAVAACYKLRSLLSKKVILHSKLFFKLCFLNLIFKNIPKLDSRKRRPHTKIVLYKRKLETMCRVIFKTYKDSLRSYFFSIPRKTYKLRIPRKKKSREKMQHFLSLCVWEMIRKGKINTEQRGLWKWKYNAIIIKDRRNHLFLSPISSSWLLRGIFLNSQRRYIAVLDRFLLKWSHFSKQSNHAINKLKFNCAGIKSLSNTINLLQFSHLLLSFQALVPHQFTCHKPSSIHHKPFLRNLFHIFKSHLSSLLYRWKSNCKAPISHKTPLFIESSPTSLPIFQKPLISLDSHKIVLNLHQKLILKNTFHMMLSRIHLMWNKWAISRPRGNENTITSFDTSLDLSNFVLPRDKLEKLRLVVSSLLEAYDSRRNLPARLLGAWSQIAAKRMIVLTKIKLFMKNQAGKIESQKYALSAMAICRRQQTEFTDIS